MPSLQALGWSPFFEDHLARLAPASTPGRVALESRGICRLTTEAGETFAELSGAFRGDAALERPAVGDWVAFRVPERHPRAVVDIVLPRRSGLVRHAAGKRTAPQPIAANVDVVFVVSSLNRDFNPRRLERALTLAWDGGASPVVVLTKSDLAESPEEAVREVEAVAPGAAVEVVSALAEPDDARARLATHLAPGRTAALIGSSGVGKSTLVNVLLGRAAQEVAPVREGDAKGRHTTTARQLIVLPDGALLVDTPGLRELQLWGDEEALERPFEDVAALAEHCRFRDCRHRGEPGCAVRRACEYGTLDPERLESYQKLARELTYLELRRDHAASYVEKKRWHALMTKKGEIRG